MARVRDKRYRGSKLVIPDIGALSKGPGQLSERARLYSFEVGDIETNNYSIRVSFLITEGHRVERFRKNTSGLRR